MLKLNLSKTDFINYLKRNVSNDQLPVKMVIRPKRGWRYEIRSGITDIVFESETEDTYIAFINNAFSDEYSVMTSERMINTLENVDKDVFIAFEIYGVYGNTNEQIIIVTPELSDIMIKTLDDYIIIIIEVDSIFEKKIFAGV